MFSDKLSFGFPAEEIYLLAYIDLLKQTNRGAVWMIAGLQVNLRRIISTCLERGGHIRTGLEDSYFYSEIGNLDLVRQTAKLIRMFCFVGKQNKLSVQRKCFDFLRMEKHRRNSETIENTKKK